MKLFEVYRLIQQIENGERESWIMLINGRRNCHGWTAVTLTLDYVCCKKLHVLAPCNAVCLVVENNRTFRGATGA